MTYDNLLIAREGAVAVVTVNRPSKLNALDAATLRELGAALPALAAEGARAIVLTGAGEKAFVAGADIEELAALTPAAAQAHAALGQQAFDAIERLGVPVIAAINGFALGGGCELAMACTIRLAADTARFGQPEVNLGLTPGFAGTQRLPRLVGRGRALELLLTGDMITAQRAHDIGLVNRVVPAAELQAEARTLAQTLAAKAPLAVRYILDAVLRGADMPLADAQYLESVTFGLAASTADMKEGTSAFLAKPKRPAVWKGQ